MEERRLFGILAGPNEEEASFGVTLPILRSCNPTASTALVFRKSECLGIEFIGKSISLRVSFSCYIEAIAMTFAEVDDLVFTSSIIQGEKQPVSCKDLTCVFETISNAQLLSGIGFSGELTYTSIV